MKSKEELNELKEEVETVSRKLHELTEDELAQVTGGNAPDLGEFELKRVQGGGIISTLESRIG